MDRAARRGARSKALGLLEALAALIKLAGRGARVFARVFNLAAAPPEETPPPADPGSLIVSPYDAAARQPGRPPGRPRRP